MLYDDFQTDVEDRARKAGVRVRAAAGLAWHMALGSVLRSSWPTVAVANGRQLRYALP